MDWRNLITWKTNLDGGECYGDWSVRYVKVYPIKEEPHRLPVINPYSVSWVEMEAG
jgi:hypothetical protein